MGAVRTRGFGSCCDHDWSDIVTYRGKGNMSKCKSTCCLLGCLNRSEIFFAFVRCNGEWRFVQCEQIHLGFPVVSMPEVAKRGASRRLDRKCLNAVWSGNVWAGNV